MNEPSFPLGFVAPEPSELAALFPAYEIHDLIATGGMGAVYRAVQKSLDRTVAIKILPMEFSQDAEFCAGFEAEAKAMARLNHPNLIAVYDFGSVNGMLFIVMEFVPGKSIYHSAYGKAIDPLEVIRLVTGVCNGLAHAHENGILHRDIKPSNILLTSQAEPKIGDFGLARPMERKTQAGEEIFGTPGYTAPEVVNSPEEVNHRADLFSVGVFLHELLTGKLPADDARPASVISGCDVRFDAIIRRATHPLAANRYSSAAEIASELQQIITARKPGSIAQETSSQQAGSARPPQHRRTAPVAAKRQLLNLRWVGPLIAISIMAFCWYQFMNMKPRVVVIEDPATKSASARDPKSASEIVDEPAEPQTELSSMPQQQPQFVPADSNVPDIVESEVDGNPTTENFNTPLKSGTETNAASIEPLENSGVAVSSKIPSDAKSYNGKKYLVFSDKCNWEIALKRCEDLGGRLAIIPDAATQEFLEDLVAQQTLWLGATDEKSEGKWRWIDGTEMKFKNFGNSLPDNWDGLEHWLAMNWKAKDGEWNDVGNDRNFGYICEWGNSLSIASSTAGITKDATNQNPTDLNTWKNKALEEFPTLKDPSSDLGKKVKALKEKASPVYFKNPQWPYLLAKEASLELEKAAQTAKNTYASRFPEGAKDFNGKKYFVYDDKCTWYRAKAKCADVGGQLAVIPDEATQKFIKSLIDGRSLWLGATDKKKEGKWIWVDETEMKYKAFHQNQPNNMENEQNFLLISEKGFWNDSSEKSESNGVTVTGYICEWPNVDADPK